MELVDVALKFGLPALGAIGGFVGTAYSYKSKLENLVKDFEKYKTDQEKEREKEKKELEKLLGGFQRELEDVEGSFRAFERASGASFAKDAELNNFIEEQQRQWQAMHRTLGQIEGVLKSQRRWTPLPQPPHGTSR